MSDDGTSCISVINASAINRTIELIRKYFAPSDLYGYQPTDITRSNKIAITLRKRLSQQL